MTTLQELRSNPSPDRTLELLKRLSAYASGPRALLTLHEHLLFYKAYPRSAAIRKFCEAELGRFEQRLRALNKSQRAELAQTSIAGTIIYYPYDEPTARWLCSKVKGRIDIDWQAYAERDTDPLSEYLALLTETAEGDEIDDPETTAQGFIESASAPTGRNSLEWVLDCFARAFHAPVRQHIYNSMNLSVAMELTANGPSRTLLDDGAPSRLFIWDPERARAKFDLVAEIQRPIRIPSPLEPSRGKALLDLAFGTLLPRLRELYPATHGNPAEVYDVPLDRGIRMILWFMVPEFRLPLEVGWGLLILKNNVPIGYGAGGMLHNRSEIAINVFDTFRGGEAAWLYSQLARILNSLCRAPWLVTRPYQLGFENQEGIVSGSFWFYDKLGFRSVDPDIRKLAEKERAQIAKHRGYRTPRRVLKKLCQADVVLSLRGDPPEGYQEYPLANAGFAASRIIASEFGGDRWDLQNQILTRLTKQFGVSFRGWTKTEKSRGAQMGLLVLSQPDVDRLPTRDKITVFELCRLKGSVREADYARAFRTNRKFFDSLSLPLL